MALAESSWLTLLQRQDLFEKIKTERGKFITPNSYADSYLFKHVLDFIREFFINDENGVNVYDEWENKSAGKFCYYFAEKLLSLSFPIKTPEGNIIIKSIVELLEERTWELKIKNLQHASSNLEIFLRALLSVFPLLVIEWNVPIGNVAPTIVHFIGETVYDIFLNFIAEDKNGNYLRRNVHIPIGLFMNTFDSSQGIDNAKELGNFTEAVLETSGFKEFDPNKNQLQFFYERGSPRKRRETKSIERLGRTMIPFSQNRDYKIDVTKNFKAAIPFLASKKPRAVVDGVHESDQEYQDRLYNDDFLPAFKEKVKAAVTVFQSITPASAPDFFNQFHVKMWQCYQQIGSGKRGSEIDIDLKYYSINGYQEKQIGQQKEIVLYPTIMIVFRDNFSILFEYAPAFIAMLMELAKLQPLTKAKIRYVEWEGGAVDIPKTLRRWEKYNDMGFVERDRVKFKERDKGKIAIILDISSSMTTTDDKIKVCAIDGIDSTIKCPHGDKYYITSPSVRFAQFMATIIIYIFKDFVSEMQLGFIESQYHLDFRHYEPEDWDILLFDLWNVYITDGTDYYALQKLEDDTEFFSGYNKKFVFVITDANESDIFGGGYRNGNIGNYLALRHIAADKNTNLIYLQISNPKDPEQMGFRKLALDNVIHSYTKTMAKYYILSKLEKLPTLTDLLLHYNDQNPILEKRADGKLMSKRFPALISVINQDLANVDVTDTSKSGEIKKLIWEDSKNATSGDCMIIVQYVAWMYANWDMQFFTDYTKLSLVGELQRFVEMVKNRNFLKLTRK